MWSMCVVRAKRFIHWFSWCSRFKELPFPNQVLLFQQQVPLHGNSKDLGRAQTSDLPWRQWWTVLRNLPIYGGLGCLRLCLKTIAFKNSALWFGREKIQHNPSEKHTKLKTWTSVARFCQHLSTFHSFKPNKTAVKWWSGQPLTPASSSKQWAEPWPHQRLDEYSIFSLQGWHWRV